MNRSQDSIRQSQTRYSEWVQRFSSLPIFLEPWWINTVTNGKWTAIFSTRKDGSIRAAWPLAITQRAGIRIIKMPKQTQHLGPWIDYPPGLVKANRRISHENEIYQDLILQLPSNIFFKQKFSTGITNCLPFYWANFNCQPMYTYRINLATEIDGIYQAIESNIKQDISKAEKILKIQEIDDIDKFYDINEKSFIRQNKKMPYSREFSRAIDAELKLRGKRRITIAVDEQDQIHAGVYIIFDSSCAYYLWGGGDPALRNSGATSLLLFDAIRDAKNKVMAFDFEGSMIKGVEKYVRAFGGTQTQYFEISKSTFIVSAAKQIKGFFK